MVYSSTLSWPLYHMELLVVLVMSFTPRKWLTVTNAYEWDRLGSRIGLNAVARALALPCLRRPLSHLIISPRSTNTNIISKLISQGDEGTDGRTTLKWIWLRYFVGVWKRRGPSSKSVVERVIKFDDENIFNAWVATRDLVIFTNIPVDGMAKQERNILYRIRLEGKAWQLEKAKEGCRSTGPISVALFQPRIF